MSAHNCPRLNGSSRPLLAFHPSVLSISASPSAVSLLTAGSGNIHANLSIPPRSIHADRGKKRSERE